MKTHTSDGLYSSDLPVTKLNYKTSLSISSVYTIILTFPINEYWNSNNSNSYDQYYYEQQNASCSCSNSNSDFGDDFILRSWYSGYWVAW